jgi:peptide/nickel transport system substrate-binding protein
LQRLFSLLLTIDCGSVMIQPAFVWFKNRKRITQFLGLFFLSALLFIGCGTANQSGTSGGAAVDNRISLGTTAKIRTLDPADAYEVFTGNLLYNLGDRLYTYEAGQTNLEPQLATALPEVSADGLEYRIPLRQGVTFHDGTPFNAEAMAFSLNRFMENGGQPAFLLSDTVASVTATGEYELTIRLNKPFAAFPALLAFSGMTPVSPKVYEQGQGKFKPAEFVGTGPYRLARYGSDSIRLDAFDQYWGDQPQNQGIDIQIFSSGSNLFNAFRTRQVDVAYQSLDPDQINALQKQADRGELQAIAGPGSNITYLTLNTQNQPLEQVAVRQAIAGLINRDLLQTRVFKGQVEPLYSLIPTIYPASQPVFENQYSLSQVKEKLQQAGYSQTKPLTVNLWYRSNVPSDGPAAATIKAYAEQEMDQMVQVQLSSVESATAYNNLDKGTYPIFMLDYYGDFYDPDTYIQPFLACAQGSPQGGCKEGATVSQGSFYYNARINQLIDQERQALDDSKRQQIFAEIQTILAQEVPFIPLWQNKDYAFAQRNIEGARLELTQQFPFWTLQELEG